MSIFWARRLTRATIRALPRPKFRRRGGRKHAEEPERALVELHATRPHARRERCRRAGLRSTALTSALFVFALGLLALVVLKLLGTFR